MIQQNEPLIVSDLESQHQVNPQDDSIAHRLAVAYAQNHQHDKAIPILLSLIDRNPGNPDLQHLLGSAYYKLNQYEEALKVYQSLALDYPNISLIHQAQGQIYLDLKQYQDAENAFKSAIDINPNDQNLYLLLGNVYLHQELFSDAIALYEKAAEFEDNNPYLLNNIGVALIQNKQPDEAIKYFQRVLSIQPNNEDAHNNLGNIYLNKENLPKAEEHFKHCNRLTPQNLIHQINFCFKLIEQKEYEKVKNFISKIDLSGEYNSNQLSRLLDIFLLTNDHKNALSIIDKILEANPENTDIYLKKVLLSDSSLSPKQFKEQFDSELSSDSTNIEAKLIYGILLRANNYLTESQKIFEDIINQDPGHVKAYTNLAITLTKQGNFNGSIICCELALNLAPYNPTLYCYLSNNYITLNEPDKAFEVAKIAMDHLPGNSEILLHCAIVQISLDKKEEAKKYALQAIEKLIHQYNNREKPDTPLFYTISEEMALTMFLFQCLDTFDWENYSQYKPILDIIMEEQKNESSTDILCTPFQSQVLSDDLIVQKNIAHEFSKNFIDNSLSLAQYHKSDSDIIKVGFISPDFRQHSVSFLLGDLFQFHDKNKVHTSCYSIFNNKNSSDSFKDKIIDSSDAFYDLSEYSHYDAAKKINDDNIDILIDLAGYTRNSRTEILGYKPAPIQAHFLGYIGTLGAEFIDYFITDDVITHPEEYSFFTEKIVSIPSAMSVPRFPDPKSWPTRSDFNLPENVPIFASFNRSYRICQETFSTWASILKKVPNSYLWLNLYSLESRNNLHQAAINNGIDPNRLILTGPKLVNDDWHHCLADVILDPFHISGATMIALSLWCNTPIVVKNGNLHVRRTAASYAMAANMPELIAQSNEEYVDLAVKLVTDKDFHQGIKDKMKTSCKTSPLFNQKQFAENLEKAYFSMIERYRQGLKPDHIRIT